MLKKHRIRNVFNVFFFYVDDVFTCATIVISQTGYLMDIIKKKVSTGYRLEWFCMTFDSMPVIMPDADPCVSVCGVCFFYSQKTAPLSAFMLQQWRHLLADALNRLLPCVFDSKRRECLPWAK